MVVPQPAVVTLRLNMKHMLVYNQNIANGKGTPAMYTAFHTQLGVEAPIPTTRSVPARPTPSSAAAALPTHLPASTALPVLRPPVAAALPARPRAARAATVGHLAMPSSKHVVKSIEVAVPANVKRAPKIARIPEAGKDAKLGSPSHSRTLVHSTSTSKKVRHGEKARVTSLVPGMVASAFVSAMQDAPALQGNAALQDQALTVAARVAYAALDSIGVGGS